jgi:hypothetical protein
MGTSKAIRLGSSVCLLALAACGGGGGGGSTAPVTTPPTTPVTTPPVTTPPVIPTVSIAAPATTGVSAFGGTGTNFTTNPPPTGSTLVPAGSTVLVTSTSVADANIGKISAIYRGTVTSGGVTYPIFDLSVPELSLTASNVRGDATFVTLPNGGQISTAMATMTYTLLGAWTYIPAGGGTAYFGQGVSGYATAPASVPSTGTATYLGNGGPAGGVVGAYFVPSGTGTVQVGSLRGDVSINVDFGTNKSSGTFNNMTATPNGSTASTPWNSLVLSGSLDRVQGGVIVGGAITNTGAPANAGAAGFSAAATGSYAGQLYGPAAQEVGGTWKISEPNSTNGKAAIGVFGATKQ